jgi:hypothetical protein
MIYNEALKPRLLLILMMNSKTYLNVPYAEKNAAKALGARWDASNKKWYAPDNMDMTLFEKWNNGSASSAGKAKSKPSAGKPALGTVTHSKVKNFIAYSSDLPPWE